MVGETLKTVHLFMERWYVRKLDKVQHQSWFREYQDSEKTSIYHHKLRKKKHKEVRHFQDHVLLIHPANLDRGAPQALLAEDAPVFSH